MWASAHLIVVFVFSLCHRLLAGCEVVLLSLGGVGGRWRGEMKVRSGVGLVSAVTWRP